MYKTILVHVDETARCEQRAAAAARLALLHDGHLVGAAMTGLQTYLMPVGPYPMGIEVAGVSLDQLHAEARLWLDRFEQAATAVGQRSIERRCVDDDPALGMALHARYCDLAVISQNAADEFLPRLRADFPDYVVLNAPRPVLVLPVRGSNGALGERVTVAWNGSPEASRAVASAIPLLQRAQQVDLVIFEAGTPEGVHGEEPGADLALYLARHGVRAEVSTRASGSAEGSALIAFAQEKRSDLIVMGAYGRSRFREILLGGMTRDLLATSPLPLWMAH